MTHLLISLLLAAGALPSDTARVSETVITATRAPMSGDGGTLSTVSVVSREKLEASRNPSALSTLTARIPGFFLTQRGMLGYGVSGGSAGAMTLRGQSVLVLIDGQPQYQGIMGHPIPDACLADMAERIEVARGPQSVLYGSGAMGGVVNIITRRPPDGPSGPHAGTVGGTLGANPAETAARRPSDCISRTHAGLGAGSYATLLSDICQQVRIRDFSATATASYNRTRGHRPNEPFSQAAGGLKLGYDFSPRWTLSSETQFTQFFTANPGPADAPIVDSDQRVTRLTAALRLGHRYRRAEGALQIHYAKGRNKVDDGHTAGAPPRNYEFNSADDLLGLSVYESLSLAPGQTATVGADYFVFGGQQWNRMLADGTKQSEKDYHRRQITGYADLRQHIAQLLTLEAGVRADHHSTAGTAWTAQGGAIFRLPAEATLKASVSQGFRFPSLRELYTMSPANPDLREERSMNYELAYRQRLAGGKLEIGANLYYLDADNLIQTAIIDGRPRFVNSGTVYNTGLELEAALAAGRYWTVSANYGFTHMAHPLTATPRHKVCADIGFRKGAWQLNTGLQYVHGLYTSATTTENFLLWDARAAFRPCRVVTLWAKGENLLAQAYEINAGFPMPRATVTAGLSLDF